MVPRRKKRVSPWNKLVALVEKQERRLETVEKKTIESAETRRTDIQAMNAVVASMGETLQQFANSLLTRFEQATGPFLADVRMLQAQVRTLEAFKNEHEEQYPHTKIAGD